MNFWSKLIHVFAGNQQVREIILAPNAPLVSRSRAGALEVIGSEIASSDDVMETFSGLLSVAPGGHAAYTESNGTICLGIKNIGRLRISYLTQRGSKLLRCVRIPYELPQLSEVFEDAAGARSLVEMIQSQRCSLLLMNSPNAALATLAGYALVAEINASSGGLIYMVEDRMTYLMSHNKSIIVQVETASDARSVQEAIASGISMEPDVTFVGELGCAEVPANLSQLVRCSTCTLLTVTNKHGEDDLRSLGHSLAMSSGHSEGVHALAIRANDAGQIVCTCSVIHG